MSTTHKIIYGSIGILGVVAGIVGMVGYAIPALEDLLRPDIHLSEALVSCFLILLLTLSAFYVGFRYLRRLFPK